MLRSPATFERAMGRSPLIDHVGELRKRHSVPRPFRADVTLDGLTLSSAWVPADDEIHVDLTLEAIHEAVVATGTIAFKWEGECRRCLGPVRGDTEVTVREVFEATPVEGETWPLGVDTLNLEPMVRETVVLALPLAPLCRADCRGPAPARFPAMTAVDQAAEDLTRERSSPLAPDPRWAALDALTFDE